MTKPIRLAPTLPLALILGLVVAGHRAGADEVITDDLIVDGSACIGANCADGREFGFDTLVIDNPGSSILFTDTSSTAAFPTTDWRMGTSESNGAFFIENCSTASNVLEVAVGGNAVALGGGSTLVDGAVSVGSAGALRRVVNVADATELTDAVTLGQFQTEIAAIDPSYLDAIDDNADALLELGGRIDQVGAIGAAMSALAVNPRGEGDHFVSFGLGAYRGETALALGSFHFFAGNSVFVNTGISSATLGGGTAGRIGITFGN